MRRPAPKPGTSAPSGLAVQSTAGGGNAAGGAGGGGLVHASTIKTMRAHAEDGRADRHGVGAGIGAAAAGAGGTGAGSGGGLHYGGDFVASESFDVLEMDLSAMGQSATVTQAVTRDRRLDVLGGVVVLRASVKGVAQAAGNTGVDAVVGPIGNQSGAVVRGVAASDEPRLVLYLDTGWYHILDRTGTQTVMLLLPRKNANRAFSHALERQLGARLHLSPRMSSEVQLPLGVAFPTHHVHVTEDGQIRDTAAYYEDEHRDDGEGGTAAAAGGAAASGLLAKRPGGADKNREGGAGGSSVDLSIIRDLELRRLLESTGAVNSAEDIEVLLNFGITSLAPAIVETASALLAASQSSNPSGRALTKLAETIGSSLTTHEIAGRMHLAVPVARAVVTAFAALLQLCQHQPAVCAQSGAGDAIVDAVERCTAALLVGSFETCFGQQEQQALRLELAQLIASALSLLQRFSSSDSHHREDGSGGGGSPPRGVQHGGQRGQYGGQFRALVAPLLGRALLFMLAMIAPLPGMQRQILDALADSHASQIIHATHSTATVFTSASLAPAKLVDSYVALAACVAVSGLASEALNAWAGRMVTTASSGFGAKQDDEQYLRGRRRGATPADAASSTGGGGGSFLLSGQFVVRAATTALALATHLLENCISERALATITSRSVVNRESAAQDAAALLASRVWVQASKEAALALYQLHVRLSEAVVFMCAFSGLAAHEALCWNQAVTTLSTPLRRMASWYGTLFPPETSAERAAAAHATGTNIAGDDEAGGAAAGAGGAGTATLLSASATVKKAVNEIMTRAACRFLTARASVDGMHDGGENAFLFDLGGTSSLYRGGAGSGVRGRAGIDPASASTGSAASSSWLVRCAALCGTSAIRTEIIGSCAVLVRLQVLAAGVLLAPQAQRSGGGGGNPSFLGIVPASTPPAHFGRTPLGGSLMATSTGALAETELTVSNRTSPTRSKPGGAAAAAATASSTAEKSKRAELMRRIERVWTRLMAQLSATVGACPQPSTAHSVWSTAALITHRFSQATTAILQKGTVGTAAAAPAGGGRDSLLNVASGNTPVSDARAASNLLANAALMCSSLLLSVPNLDTLTTFSGAGLGAAASANDAMFAGAAATGLPPPDAASYLSGDAWDGLAEFENHCIFSPHEAATVASAAAPFGLPAGAAGAGAAADDLGERGSYRPGSGGSRMDLTPSVQDEAFWYIDRSCEDENEGARLMTVSRRRLQAVQDARETAAAPPARCAWFASRAVRDFAFAFFRARQDMFEDEATVALVCRELASLFFFGSSIQHASAALIPVLACVRQTGGQLYAEDEAGAPRRAAAARASTNPAKTLFDAQLAMVRQQSQQQRQSLSRGNSPARVSHQQQQPLQRTSTPHRTTPLKRESVLVETLRSQRMLHPSSADLF